MKLTRLDLTRFGRFEDHALELDPTASLHVLFGRNAAGKTTIAAAVEYALFDWPTARSERDFAFRFPTSKLRIGIGLAPTDGAPLELVRRKGRGTTVLDPATGTASDELAARLQRLLRGVTRDQWRRRHGLTKERLVAGGRALQRSGGELGSALAAAQDGIGVLQQVLADVVERRAAIDNGNRSGTLVDAVREFEAATKDVKVAAAQAARYGDDVEHRDALDARFEELREQVVRLETERAHLTYAQGAAARLERWQQLATQIDAAAPAIEAWSSALHDQWYAAAAGERSERAQLDQEAPRFEALRNERDALVVDDRLLALHDQTDQLRQRLAQAADARTKLPVLERDVEAARAEGAALGDLDAAMSDEALADVVDRALKIDVDEVRDRAAAVQEALRALELRASALPGCELDLAGVRAMALPPAAEVAALADRIVAIDAAIAKAQEDIRNAVDHRAKNREELRQLQASGDVPSIEQLTELRSERDAAWGTVRLAVLRGGDGTALDDAHEAVRCVDDGIRDADAYADRYAVDRERAGQASELSRLVADDDVRERVASERRAELEAERAQLLATAWRELWAQGRVAAASVDAMRQFVADVAAIREDAAKLDASVAKVRSDEARVRMLCTEFAHLLGEGADAGAGTAPAEADELTRFSALRGQAKHRRDTAASTQARAQVATTKLQGAEHQLEQARAVLASFTSGVRSLLDAAGTPASGVLAPDAAEAALTTLWQDITATAQAAQRRRALDEQVRELERSVSRRTAALSALAVELAEIRASAGAADDAALRALDARWLEAQDLVRERREIDDEVRAHASAAVPELIALRDADETVPTVRIERLGERIDQRSTERTAARAERDELVARIKQLQTSTALVDASERRAAALARVEELVPIMRRLALQEQLLREFIDTHARESRGPLVERAGAYFARITCGEFAGIEVDRVAADTFALVGVPAADGDDNVRVDDLSEGTIDQLYLALRLAAVALEHESGGEPMPLIVDDVLASFDNDRARATLALFADLGAAGIQILFLTHHQHLVDIAVDELGDGRVRVVDVGAAYEDITT